MMRRFLHMTMISGLIRDVRALRASVITSRRQDKDRKNPRLVYAKNSAEDVKKSWNIIAFIYDENCVAYG